MRMSTSSSGAARGGAELVAVRRGVACGLARSAASLGSYGERIRWFADAARSPRRGVEIRPLTCVKMNGPRRVHKSRSEVKCFQSCLRHDSHSARKKQVCVTDSRRYPATFTFVKMFERFREFKFRSQCKSFLKLFFFFFLFPFFFLFFSSFFFLLCFFFFSLSMCLWKRPVMLPKKNTGAQYCACQWVGGSLHTTAWLWLDSINVDRVRPCQNVQNPKPQKP